MFGVIVDVEVVDEDLQRLSIDLIVGFEVGGIAGVQLGEITETLAIQLVQEEILVVHVLVITDFDRVDLCATAKGLPVAF